jgi:hypothetical protein
LCGQLPARLFELALYFLLACNERGPVHLFFIFCRDEIFGGEVTRGARAV